MGRHHVAVAVFAVAGCVSAPPNVAPRGTSAPDAIAPRDPAAAAPTAPADSPLPLEPATVASDVAAPVDPTAGASFRGPLTMPSPSPATRLADLSPSACMKELAARKLPFVRSKQAAAGVATPLRSEGPLRGVRIVIPRAPSLFGVLDCRLALALDELAEVLAAHDVVEIQIDNTYRPKAHLPGKQAKSQHAYGLALDVTQLRLRSGVTLQIERDWHAPIGSTSCGPDAQMDDPSPASIALRDVTCDVARRGIFHHILSPSWDAAHRNHLHLDVARKASRQAMH